MGSRWRAFSSAAMLAGVVLLFSITNGTERPPTVEAAQPSQLTISVVTTPTGGTGFSFEVSSPCSTTTTSLGHNGSQVFSCSTSGDWTIEITSPSGWDLVSFNCIASDPGATPSDFTVTPDEIANESIGLNFQDGADLTCQASFTDSGGGGSGGEDLTPEGRAEKGQIAVVASPNGVPCGGGTVNLTATGRDVFGRIIEGLEFNWTTDAGILKVGPPNNANATEGHATLTLPSSVMQATVAAHVGSAFTEIVVNQICGQVAIAVTADPNVIPCGGTAVLTATARDGNGHIVTGVGFHWATDVGLLNVGPPNTAAETDGIATLTLVPGMASATAKAWVGDLSGAPGQVTVQQFCPGVTTDASTAPGAVQLSSSKNVLGCRESIFVGARVRDSKNQVVPDGTVVNFMASDGVFATNDGETSQFTAVTINGVLNIPYRAPNYGGNVFITAATGDKFSQMAIEVRCAAPAPSVSAASAGSGSSSPAPRPCIPIGDGICITPPSTGQGSQIRPPSTGDAGLR